MSLGRYLRVATRNSPRVTRAKRYPFPWLVARSPFAPSMKGQYILKNLVLMSAAVGVGATRRGGRLVARPPARLRRRNGCNAARAPASACVNGGARRPAANEEN